MSAVRGAIAGACFLLLFVVGPTPCEARQSGAPKPGVPKSGAAAPTDRELAESKRRLEQIRRERTQLRDEMSRIRARVGSLSGQLTALQRQVGSSASAVEEVDSQVREQQAEIEANQRELEAAQNVLGERRAILHRRLREIYKRGPLHTAEVLLTAESFSELLNRYKYLFLVARRDKALVRDVASLESELVTRERALRTSLFELERVLDRKDAEHRELEGRERVQQQALAAARARERSAQQRIEQLTRDEQRLSGLLATLERRRREAERVASARPGGAAKAPAPATGSTLTTGDLGRLRWPAQGRLLYRFGRTTQANGTVVRRNGIGIRGVDGGQVRAVEEGTVVMAGPFEGYGPTVIVSHGGGYYSLYLYLGEISVKNGARVARADQVGTAGGERAGGEATVEFQIRAPGGQAVDPLVWLQQGAAR